MTQPSGQQQLLQAKPALQLLPANTILLESLENPNTAAFQGALLLKHVRTNPQTCLLQGDPWLMLQVGEA